MTGENDVKHLRKIRLMSLVVEISGTKPEHHMATIS